jgi:hypothetical protein
MPIKQGEAPASDVTDDVASPRSDATVYWLMGGSIGLALLTIVLCFLNLYSNIDTAAVAAEQAAVVLLPQQQTWYRVAWIALYEMMSPITPQLSVEVRFCYHCSSHYFAVYSYELYDSAEG